MRIDFLAVWIVAVIVGWSQAGSAGTTEIEKDEKTTSKYALEHDKALEGKARGLCVCIEHPAVPQFEGKRGILVFQRIIENLGGSDRDTISIECRPYAYDQTTGKRNAYPDGGCDSWVPLAK